jgi:chromosome segregation ATPase
MDPITLRLEPEIIEELDDEYEERGFRNRTLYLRHLVEKRDMVFESEQDQEGAAIEATEQLAEYGEQLSTHTDRLEDLDERVEDLEEQARPFSWSSRSSDSSP